jgi:lipopolysaccharide transport system ATP-binding protein
MSCARHLGGNGSERLAFEIGIVARYFGPADLAVDQYLAFMRDETNREALADQAEHPWKRPVPRDASLDASLRYGSGHVQIMNARMLGEESEPKATFQFGERAILEVRIVAKVNVENLNVNFLVRDGTGIDLFGTSTFDEKVSVAPMRPGHEQTILFSFPIMVRPGSYGAAVSVTRVTRRDYSDVFLFDQAEGIAAFSVIADPARPVHYKFHIDTKIEVGVQSAF